MKKIGFFIMLIAMTTVFFACDSDDDQAVPSSDLPQVARVYIETHFANNAITSVKKENDGGYDVFLEGGYDLDFDAEGNIESIEGTSAIPDSVLPEAVLNYLHANYSDAVVLGWEQDTVDQEVKLSSGVELVFDLQGQFIRADN